MLGFLLMVLGLLIPLVATLSRGERVDSFLLAFLVIALLLTALVSRFGAWAWLTGAVLGTLLLIMLMGFGAAFALGHPESFLDFAPSVLIVVGLAMGVTGAVIALIQRRRGTARTVATVTERRAISMIVAALAVVALISGALTLTGRTTVAADVRAEAVALQMKDFSFNPARLQAKSGETVRLVITNAGTTLHTFTIRELGVNANIAPGNEALVEFQAPSAGTYTWICVPHATGDGGMSGMLVVK
jgi:plastocyanin